MLVKFNLLSVNQLAASIKLIEVWKAKNVEGYALSLDPYKQPQPDTNPAEGHNLRHQTNRIYNDSSRLMISKQSFNIDAARMWNLAPIQIKTALTINSAKSAITDYVKSLPI